MAANRWSIRNYNSFVSEARAVYGLDLKRRSGFVRVLPHCATSFGAGRGCQAASWNRRGACEIEA